MADHLHVVRAIDDVHDGDTFTAFVKLDFYVEIRVHVRIKDLWCPELKEPGGLAARQALEDLLASVLPIEIRSYKDEMSFQRWVCDVFVADLVVAEAMIAAGYGFKTKKEQQAWVQSQTK